ncbi:MAG: rhodanese-like domain-containing protein [Myxococcota bacterium]
MDTQRHPDGFLEISADAVRTRLGEFRVVDVREPHEFTGPLGHVDGAALVPLATVADAAAGWDRARPILLVCRSGARSGRAASLLVHMGFRHVHNLTGGMMGWVERGYPVVGRGA